MLKSLAVLLFLAFYVNAQGFQGGTMTYRIMRTKADDVVIRYHHKFLQYRPSDNDKKVCKETCARDLIAADEMRYKRFNATKEEIKNFNSSFYCDLYNEVDNIIIGSRETDVLLARKYDLYEFNYLDCCEFGVVAEIRPTYKQAKFQLDVNLKKREDTGEINNPPDTRFAPLYAEMKFATSKTVKLSFPDTNGDIVRCEWSSNSCAASGNCKAFSLNTDCTLTLTQSEAPQLFSIGILVKDYYNTSVTFTTPLSTVPFYMIVNVLGDSDNRNRTAIECPESKSRPVQNQMNNSNILTISLIPLLLCLVFSKFY